MNDFLLWGSLFNSCKGRFFSVCFRKKNGQLRKINGNVATITVDPRSDTQYITVFDVQNRGYRRVNTKTIKSFKCGNIQVGPLW